jgi:hypothetical protein
LDFSNSLKLPQRDSVAGITVFFTHVPLQNIKKSSLGFKELSINSVDTVLKLLPSGLSLSLVLAQLAINMMLAR